MKQKYAGGINLVNEMRKWLKQKSSNDNSGEALQQKQWGVNNVVQKQSKSVYKQLHDRCACRGIDLMKQRHLFQSCNPC